MQCLEVHVLEKKLEVKIPGVRADVTDSAQEDNLEDRELSPERTDCVKLHQFGQTLQRH